MTVFRFGSYNVENGGVDDGDPRRLRRQLAMLAQARADAWAIQEAKHWTDDEWALLHLAEQELSMTGYLARSAHHGCHLVLLVREHDGMQVTAERHEHWHPYWHAVARVKVCHAGLGGPLHLISAHLAPASPALRLIEAESLALMTKDGPLIAGGDWNAAPATDPDPPADDTNGGHARRKLDRSAARALEEVGLLDIAAHLGDTTPTVGHISADTLAYRCDRI
jgi:endonuclease/exonuclease/phosphatase family metal-dependent hydrolase